MYSFLSVVDKWTESTRCSSPVVNVGMVMSKLQQKQKDVFAI